MNQNIYILYDEQNEYVANRIFEAVNADGKFYSPDSELTTNILIDIASKCPSEYFYIIKSDKEILFPNFNFTYKPETWDRNYVGIWNQETCVRILNREAVLENPSKYNDMELKNGNINLKSKTENICTYPSFDIIFLSYDEENSDTRFNNLKERFPRAKRIHGVKGIYEAHKAAAEMSKTDMFYVIDADAKIMPTFDFSYQPHSLDRESVHVWHSLNPVNKLEYGYGAVKLFPTKLLKDYIGSPIDFTTSVSKSFKVIEEVSNITEFNTDPFSAWRSGFRECVKLASKIILKQDNSETEHRLHTWCTIGSDVAFGDFAMMGANEGREFGNTYADQPEMIGLINDYTWLEKRFNS